MDNKLSELSINARKAANSFYNWSQLANCTSERLSCLTVEQLKETSELFSALLAELETERTSRELWQQNCSRAEQRIAELSRLQAHNIERAEEAEKRLATPVQLQNCDFESVAIMAHWCTDEQLKAWVKGVEHAKKQIRAAGFTVEGDE